MAPSTKGNRGKIFLGLAVSAVFLYLAFRQVDFGEMWDAFRSARYGYFIPALGIVFLSHYLRAYRWRFLLEPVKRVGTSSLFSALIIGYMANVFMPAHLGEFLRAYVISKKCQLPMSTTFGTIVMERIIDVVSLLLLMVVTLLAYPFPPWVTHSGYLLFAGTAALIVGMLLLKRNNGTVIGGVRFCLRPFPDRWGCKLEGALLRFLGGVVPLKRGVDYAMVAFLSMVLWVCYAAVFYFSFHAFDFVAAYGLPWSASVVLLIITTVSIVVPSSPGYVGTYHYLCQVALGMFGVPPGPALSFAIVVHAINFLSVFVVGLFFARHEGMAISRMARPGVQEEC